MSRCLRYLFASIVISLCLVCAHVAVAQGDGGTATQTDAGPGSSDAAPTPAADANPVDTVGNVVKAFRAGRWRELVSGAVVLLMLSLAQVRKRTKWFTGARGGALLAGLLAIGGSVIASLALGVPISASWGINAVLAAFEAVGGYVWFKDVFSPATPTDRYLANE